MPFPGVDPWRMQYFENEPIPEGVVVPIDDANAWQLYPAHRWVYNKLLIAETQGLPHGPHGTMPLYYPVFSKPIYNMRGMGMGGRVVRAEAAYLAALEPGHMWMELLVGRHVSSDAALRDGVALWWRHTTGTPGPAGTFDYWTVHAEPDAALLEKLHAVFAGAPGKGKLLLDLEEPGEFCAVLEPQDVGVNADRLFIDRVEELVGRGGVRVID